MTLSQQEDISIKGQSARQLVMQKLMKSRNASVVLLLRFVGCERRQCGASKYIGFGSIILPQFRFRFRDMLSIL